MSLLNLCFILFITYFSDPSFPCSHKSATMGSAQSVQNGSGDQKSKHKEMFHPQNPPIVMFDERFTNLPFLNFVPSIAPGVTDHQGTVTDMNGTVLFDIKRVEPDPIYGKKVMYDTYGSQIASVRLPYTASSANPNIGVCLGTQEQPSLNVNISMPSMMQIQIALTGQNLATGQPITIYGNLKMLRSMLTFSFKYEFRVGSPAGPLIATSVAVGNSMQISVAPGVDASIIVMMLYSMSLTQTPRHGHVSGGYIPAYPGTVPPPSYHTQAQRGPTM